MYTSFFCTHTPPPLSCDRADDEEVLQGGDRQLWQKKIAQDAVCIRVCAFGNARISFSQHQRPAHHREVERGAFFFQVENREKRGITFLCVRVVFASFHCLRLYKIDSFKYTGNERKWV